MPELAIFIGLQASGKSTYYRLHLSNTHVHVSKDRFRNNRRPARRQAELITEALAAGRSVVVDNTNATVGLRRELIDLSRSHGATVTGYYFASKLADCLTRNATRTGKDRVPDVGLFSVAKALVRPSPDEGFDRLFHVTLVARGTFAIEPWNDTTSPDGSDRRAAASHEPSPDSSEGTHEGRLRRPDEAV